MEFDMGRGGGWGGGGGGGGGRGRSHGAAGALIAMAVPGGRGRGRSRGRDRGAGRGRGRGADPGEDPLLENDYLRFEEGSEAYHICEKFHRMEIGDHCALDWGALEEVAEATRAREFIGHDTPWSRLFDIAYTSSYRVMAYEFLSSFDYAPRPADRPEEDDDEDDPWIEVSFLLAGQWHLMSLRQFAEHSGLYMVEELDTPIYTDGIWMSPRTTLMRFWQVISMHRFGTASKQRASFITDPLNRYLHKLISTSIAPRELGVCNNRTANRNRTENRQNRTEINRNRINRKSVNG